MLLRELQRLRFVEPQDALVIVQAGDVVAPEQEVMTQTTFKMWIVDESIWRPRKRKLRLRARVGGRIWVRVRVRVGARVGGRVWVRVRPGKGWG